MAQRAQIIDVTKSYIPIDPETFIQNLINTDREDGEEKTLPVVAYDGYNFIPTNYGQRAFFGDGTKLSAGELESRCQFFISYQTDDYKEHLIALAEDGIWTLDTTTDGASWVHSVTHTFDADIFEEWTWCVIEGIFYCYKQGYPHYLKLEVDVSFVISFTEIIPTFLNMSGQLGIFKAGTRLGFWDSANSVSWSNNVDFADFEPAIETQAGNRIFGGVKGRIVTIKSHGDGFIIYSTKSIVGASFSETATLIWQGNTVFDNVGINYSRAVTVGQNDAIHFAWTNSGILEIGSYKAITGSYDAQFIIPEIWDLLSESRTPVYLDIINNRYLFFSVFDGHYLYSNSSIIQTTVNPYLTAIRLGEGYWDGDLTMLPTIVDGNTIRTLLEQFGLGNMPSNSPNGSCIVG